MEQLLNYMKLIAALLLGYHILAYSFNLLLNEQVIMPIITIAITLFAMTVFMFTYLDIESESELS